jgi:acetylornithine deacetylase/succinyl-diaminopimelate desuccinylase-like protein
MNARYLSAATLAAASLLCAHTVSAAAPDSFERQGVELYRKLISVDTSVGHGQVPVLAEYLATQFRAAGFAEGDIHIFPLGDAASMVVRYPGNGSGGRPILLMAHLDVVTAKRGDWARDPFTLVEENGFFLGRGALDVKCGVATITSAILRLKSEGFLPSRDLIIVFSGDEETTQKTTMDLARNHRQLIDAEFALNSDGGGGQLDEQTGKPVVYALQTAEKTYESFEMTVRNPGGHSSLPRADNAIYELAAVLRRLQAYHFPVMSNETTRRYLASVGKRTPAPLGTAMLAFAAHPQEGAAAATLAASPSYVGVTRTTCVPTLLSGGHADNALPQSATVTVNCRIFPGVSVAAVQATLQKLAGPAVEFKRVAEPIESDASPLREDVFAAVTRAVHRRHPDVEVVPEQSSGASDGAVFRGVGIPTYGTGEEFIKDSEDFSHGLNERLPVQSFYDGLDFWYALIADVAGPAAHTH